MHTTLTTKKNYDIAYNDNNIKRVTECIIYALLKLSNIKVYGNEPPTTTIHSLHKKK